MAGTALYLASKAGGYTTGQDIIIDGGYVTVNPAVVQMHDIRCGMLIDKMSFVSRSLFGPLETLYL